MFSRSSLALAPVRTALSTRSLTRSASTAARSATASSRATSSSVRFGVAAFGAAAFLGAATLAAPVHLDGEAKPKRRSYNERMKRTGDGKVVIQRPVEVEEEVDAEEEATSEDGAFASLEEEASQQSAFDPETNTINWDCPCLGGMAQGPCGEEFKEAFSCFVFSEKEPKGIECVPAFQIMQDCFRRHPEIYAEELKDDEWEEAQRDGAPPETGADLSEDQPGSESKPE